VLPITCYENSHVLLSEVSDVYSGDGGFVIRVDYMARSDAAIWLTYEVISFLRSLAR